MAENNKRDPRLKIPLKRFLADYRSPLDDRELMQRYGLSARSFVNLITTLMKKNVLNKSDLDKRKEGAVQRDLARETQFLSSLYICPNCSHPSPTPFDKCPACGVDSNAVSREEEVYPPITTSEGHAYIPRTSVLEEVEEVEVEEITETDPNNHGPQNQAKPSAINSVRSFFSRKGK
jgi:hypothetical protein